MVLIIIAVIVVKGLKKAAVELVKDPPPQAQQADHLNDNPAAREALARLLAGRTGEPPPAVPPAWAPVPVGQSPLDKYQAKDLPARYRGASMPKELVAVFEPDAKHEWSSPLGLTAAAGKRPLLDARRLPPDGAKTRFLIQSDEGFTCYDLAGGTATKIGEVTADGETLLARLTIDGTHAIVSDGDTVWRVNATRDDGESDFEALADPPSPYVQMELVDGDRLLVLRQADGRVRQARLDQSAAARVMDLGPDESADDISASPDRGVLAVTSTARKTVTLFDYDGDRVMRNRLTLAVKPVRAVVHPNRRFLAVVDTGNSTRLYDIEAKKQIGEFQSRVPPRATAFAADGRHLVHLDASGRVYLFRHDRMAEPADSSRRGPAP